MKRFFWAIILGISVAFLVVSGVSRGVAASTSAAMHKAGVPGLMGTIEGPDGKPMHGVAVTAQSSVQTFKTTVFTDGQGTYVFPQLTAGDYKVWAQAVGFDSGRAAVKLDGAQTAHQDFALKTLANFDAELSGVEWMASLPEDTVVHRQMKQVLYVACAGCHGFDVILNNKFDAAGWRNILRGMESADYEGYRGADDVPWSQLGWEGEVIRHHQEDLVKYLTEMRGPGPSPMVLKPMARPEGEAARAVITQYDLPIAERVNEMSWYNGDDWMKGQATGQHGEVGVHDVLADANGNAWITQSRTTFETNRSLIKLDSTTGRMTAYRVENARGGNTYFEQIAMSPLGIIWMHGGGLTRLDPLKDSFTVYPIPNVYGGTQNSIDGDKLGRAFINGKFGTVEFDPSELGKTNVMYPGWHFYQQQTPGNGTTYGIATDADNNPWWSEAYSDIVATRNLKTGKVTEIRMHDPGYDARKALETPEDQAFYESVGALTWSGTPADPLPYSEMPRRMSADKYGDTVWVPNWAQSNIAEINIHTMKVTYHELPMKAHPYKTDIDNHHNVYASVQAGEGVFKYSPSTQKFTYFPLPTHGCSPRHMSYDRVHDEVWVPCDQADTVDRIQFRSVEQIQALEAAGKSAKQ
jgi:streptogramin lyase